MKKILNRLLIIALLLLIGGFIFSIFNSFYGNPVSAAIAGSKIRTYVRENYSDMDLDISKVKYNFKFDDYFCRIQSKTSKDTRFTVYCSHRRINDSYEDDVTQRWTTYERLRSGLDKIIEEIIKKEFPYEISILISDFYVRDKDYSSLMLDMPLDINNPSLPVKITIYILTEKVSYEDLEARLIELSDIMKRHSIPIAYYDMVLQEPMPEGEKAAPDGKSIYLYDFPAESIQAPDLKEAIKEQQRKYEQEHNKN